MRKIPANRILHGLGLEAQEKPYEAVYGAALRASVITDFRTLTGPRSIRFQSQKDALVARLQKCRAEGRRLNLNVDLHEPGPNNTIIPRDKEVAAGGHVAEIDALGGVLALYPDVEIYLRLGECNFKGNKHTPGVYPRAWDAFFVRLGHIMGLDFSTDENVAPTLCFEPSSPIIWKDWQPVDVPPHMYGIDLYNLTPSAQKNAQVFLDNTYKRLLRWGVFESTPVAEKDWWVKVVALLSLRPEVFTVIPKDWTTNPTTAAWGDARFYQQAPAKEWWRFALSAPGSFMSLDELKALPPVKGGQQV